MFERFTDRARRIVSQAQDEARAMQHDYIGTEHLVVALASNPYPDDGSIAFQILTALGVTAESVRADAIEIIGEGKGERSGHLPFTPRAKKVLELSLREALDLEHNYIGAEHILLGVIREGEGVGLQILVKQGVDGYLMKQAVFNYLGEHPDITAEQAVQRARSQGPLSNVERPRTVTRHFQTDPPTEHSATAQDLGEVIILSTSYEAVVAIGSGLVVTEEVMSKLAAAASNISQVPKGPELLRKLLE